MQKKLLIPILFSALFFSACSQQKVPTYEQIPPAPAATAQVEYDTVETLAIEGQYVLAPSSDTLEQSLTTAGEHTIFTFYEAKLLEPGDEESLIEDLLGEQYNVPNSLIIPIQSSETPSSGDIVLTWWQGGSGMMRAIVTSIDKETNLPTVKYLDKFADESETLTANSYQILNATLTPGAPVIVKTTESVEQATIINATDEKALIMGFAGFLRVTDIANLTPLTPISDLKENDQTYAPIFGVFQPITIKTTDFQNGQVTAEYKFADEIVTDTFFVDEIIKELPN